MKPSRGTSWLTQEDLGACMECLHGDARTFKEGDKTGVICSNCAARIPALQGDLALRTWNGLDDTHEWYSLKYNKPTVGEVVVVRLDTGTCFMGSFDIFNCKASSKIIEVLATYVEHRDYCWVVEEVVALTADQANYWKRDIMDAESDSGTIIAFPPRISNFGPLLVDVAAS